MMEELKDIIGELMEFVQDDILGGEYIADCFSDFDTCNCMECEDFIKCRVEIKKRKKLKKMIEKLENIKL